MPQLLTLFLFLPLISLASGQLANQQSDSSVGAQKLVDDEKLVDDVKGLVDEAEGISNGIRKSSDGVLPISRGKRSAGVYYQPDGEEGDNRHDDGALEEPSRLKCLG